MTEFDPLQDKKNSSAAKSIQQSELENSSQPDMSQNNAQDEKQEANQAAAEISNAKFYTSKTQIDLDSSSPTNNQYTNFDNRLKPDKSKIKHSNAINKIWLLLIFFLIIVLAGFSIYFGYRINQRIDQIDKQAQLALHNESQHNDHWQKHFVQASENVQQLKQLTTDENEKLKGTLNLQQQKIDNMQNELSSVVQGYRSLINDRQNLTLQAAQELYDLTQQQWVLTGNTKTALSSLNLVVEKIEPIDTMAAQALKQTILVEIAHLKSIPILDFSAIALQLDQAAMAIHSLPWSEHRLNKKYPNQLVNSQSELANNDQHLVNQQERINKDRTLIAANAKWYEHWYQQLKTFFSMTGQTASQALGNVVKVQRIDAPDAIHLPLSSNEKVLFMNQLQLHLLIAKLALLRHDSELLHNELNLSVQQINENFEKSAIDTQKMLGIIQDIQNNVVPALKLMQKNLIKTKTEGANVNEEKLQSNISSEATISNLNHLDSKPLQLLDQKNQNPPVNFFKNKTISIENQLPKSRFKLNQRIISNLSFQNKLVKNNFSLKPSQHFINQNIFKPRQWLKRPKMVSSLCFRKTFKMESVFSLSDLQLASINKNKGELA